MRGAPDRDVGDPPALFRRAAWEAHAGSTHPRWVVPWTGVRATRLAWLVLTVIVAALSLATVQPSADGSLAAQFGVPWGLGP